MAIDNIESKDNHSGLSEGKKEISEVRDTTSDKTLDIINSKENPYEGMKKVQIEVNGESKELYYDNENLRVDSSNWEIKKNFMGRESVKVNPEGDITEYIYGEEAGLQLFTTEAAEREAKKLGKRLPFAHDDTPEFQAIIEKVGIEEFKKNFPGSRRYDGTIFWYKGEAVFFCSASVKGKNIYNIVFEKSNSEVHEYWNDNYYGYSVRLVKDID